MVSTSVNPWIVRLRTSPRNSLRLFCFPYAGGGTAVYRSWGDALPRLVDICPVQLPGREARFREAAFSNVFQLVDALAPAIAPLLDKPFALFGHSMGALVAFELAHKLERDYNLLPESLFVSGRAAPSLALKHPPLNKLPDDELVQALAQLNGINNSVLGQTDLMKLLLPTLRADLALNEEYSYSQRPPLPCPIVVFGGLRDPRADPDDLDAWRDHTSGSFTKRLLEGDHFFINSPQSSFFNVFALELQRLIVRLSSRISPARCDLQKV